MNEKRGAQQWEKIDVGRLGRETESKRENNDVGGPITQFTNGSVRGTTSASVPYI